MESRLWFPTISFLQTNRNLCRVFISEMFYYFRNVTEKRNQKKTEVNIVNLVTTQIVEEHWCIELDCDVDWNAWVGWSCRIFHERGCPSSWSFFKEQYVLVVWISDTIKYWKKNSTSEVSEGWAANVSAVDMSFSKLQVCEVFCFKAVGLYSAM